MGGGVRQGRRAKKRLWAFAVLLQAGAAQAGGHFDVDDAGTLDPGRCQVEAWGGHATRQSIDFGHLGPACRVGPVELGLNLDMARAPADRLDLLGPQLKWTFLGQAADATFSAALSLGASANLSQGGGHWGGQWALPVSWKPLEPLQLNANVGQDWDPRDGTRTPRGGVGVDWAVHPQLTLVVERNRAFALWTTRAGLRWQINAGLSLDASVARIGTQGARLYILGLNQEFSR